MSTNNTSLSNRGIVALCALAGFFFLALGFTLLALLCWKVILASSLILGIAHLLGVTNLFAGVLATAIFGSLVSIFGGGLSALYAHTSLSRAKEHDLLLHDQTLSIDYNDDSDSEAFPLDSKPAEINESHIFDVLDADPKAGYRLDLDASMTDSLPSMVDSGTHNELIRIVADVDLGDAHPERKDAQASAMAKA